MQPIHRTVCQDFQPLSLRFRAGYLAALIDRQVRLRVEPAGVSAPIPCDDPGGNTLTSVEDDPGLVTRCGRGLVVAAHASDQAEAPRSFAVSFPAGADGHRRCVPAIADALATLGWTVLAARRGETAPGHVETPGHAETTFLASDIRPGTKQRLWLAEPPAAPPGHPAPPVSAGPTQESRVVPLPAARQNEGVRAGRDMRDQVETWVDEGGTGDGVAE